MAEGMSIAVQWHTDPLTDIQILEVVCCNYPAVIPPTHNGMSLEIVMALRDCCTTP